MTQSTASAPFKESTHIDENAESIYGANRSASNATTEIIPSADTASARSTNGGRGGGAVSYTHLTLPTRCSV